MLNGPRLLTVRLRHYRGKLFLILHSLGGPWRPRVLIQEKENLEMDLNIKEPSFSSSRKAFEDRSARGHNASTSFHVP